jgi:hypothetical protein
MNTETMKTFRLFSTETGHDFGVWEAASAEDAIADMANQAGELVNPAEIEAVDLGVVG